MAQHTVNSDMGTLHLANQVHQQVWSVSLSALPTMQIKTDEGLHPLLLADAGGLAAHHLLWEPAAALPGSQGCLAAERLPAGRLQVGEAAQGLLLAAKPFLTAAPPDLPAAVPEDALSCILSVLHSVHHVPISRSLTCHRSLAIKMLCSDLPRHVALGVTGLSHGTLPLPPLRSTSQHCRLLQIQHKKFSLALSLPA